MDSVFILSAGTYAPGEKSVGSFDAPPAESWFAFDNKNRLLAGLKNPDCSLSNYSPIVLYGPEACGKTRLARVLMELNSKSRAKDEAEHSVTTTIGEFDKRVRHSVVVGGLDELLTSWQTPNCWIVEDFHQFTGSSLTEQIFIQLLEHRTLSGQLTIICGRQAPWIGSALSPRLQSRLSAGLVVSLERPSGVAYREICALAASGFGLTWEADALDCVCKSEISLRSLLDRLRQIAERKPVSRVVDWATVQQLVSARHARSTRSGRLILTTVARHYRLKLADLVGSSRRQALVKARGVAICLLRDLAQMKWQAIAELTGRQDHSTVLHAYTKTRKSFAADPLLADAFRQLQQKLSANFAP